MGEQCGRPSKPRSKPSLYCRETAFRRQRQVGAKPPTGSANRSRRPTAFAQSRHVAVIHSQFGKSPFAQDCVVGLGGLELPTKRLSAVSIARTRLCDFLPACERPGSERLACTSTFFCRKNCVSSHGDHYRRDPVRVCCAIIAPESRVSGAGGTTPPASR